MNGPIELDAIDLALAALLVLANAGVSLVLRLGLERRLIVACVRAALQLALLGWLLAWVFRAEGPWAVLAMTLAMALVAGIEAVRRTTRRVPGVYTTSVTVVALGSMAITVYGIALVVQPDPWWEPRYAIPILGMILGNALNGISLGLETALEGFDAGRARVELLLATARRAARRRARSCAGPYARG